MFTDAPHNVTLNHKMKLNGEKVLLMAMPPRSKERWEFLSAEDKSEMDRNAAIMDMLAKLVLAVYACLIIIKYM
jgi:hypothetical protein